MEIGGALDDSLVGYVVQNLESGFEFNMSVRDGRLAMIAQNDGVFT